MSNYVLRFSSKEKSMDGKKLVAEVLKNETERIRLNKILVAGDKIAKNIFFSKEDYDVSEAELSLLKSNIHSQYDAEKFMLSAHIEILMKEEKSRAKYNKYLDLLDMIDNADQTLVITGEHKEWFDKGFEKIEKKPEGWTFLRSMSRQLEHPETMKEETKEQAKT